MLDELRDRIATYLAHHQICIISTSGPASARVVPEWRAGSGLEIFCRLPSWSDEICYIEQDPRVMLLFLPSQFNELRWLQYTGIAEMISAPECDSMWTDDQADKRFVTIHIVPERIDLIDDRNGCERRETLDI